MRCWYCGNMIGRLFYRIVGIKGRYCSDCAHRFHKELGYSFYLVDSQEKGPFDE